MVGARDRRRDIQLAALPGRWRDLRQRAVRRGPGRRLDPSRGARDPPSARVRHALHRRLAPAARRRGQATGAEPLGGARPELQHAPRRRHHERLDAARRRARRSGHAPLGARQPPRGLGNARRASAGRVSGDRDVRAVPARARRAHRARGSLAPGGRWTTCSRRVERRCGADRCHRRARDSRIHGRGALDAVERWADRRPARRRVCDRRRPRCPPRPSAEPGARGRAQRPAQDAFRPRGDVASAPAARSRSDRSREYGDARPPGRRHRGRSRHDRARHSTEAVRALADERFQRRAARARSRPQTVAAPARDGARALSGRGCVRSRAP